MIALALALVGALPYTLHVDGPTLRDEHNQTVLLQGLNVPSLEWSNEGENVHRSMRVAVEEWKANVVRVPLAQDRWFGRAERQDDGGKAYQAIVDEFVRYGREKRVAIILDLHWSNAGTWGKRIRQHKMPDALSVRFWRDVARRYRHDGHVLFDLYNEPRDVSWEVWRNGGLVEDKDDEGEFSYETPGMQGCLEAVRAVGAKNIVVVGGLDWGYDLGGIREGYGLSDRSGRGIVYSTHVYPWKSQWEDRFAFAAVDHPVLLGEVGCEPDAKQEDPLVWGPRMIGFIQERGLHWTAWCFHPSASPRMLKDWDYTPTEYWGVPVKEALGGKRFRYDGSR